MHRAAILLQGRRGRIVWSLRVVVGLVAVGAPEALDLAGVGVHHRDAPVAIAVGDEGFVGFRIDINLGHAPEIFRIAATGVLALVTGLQQELAILGELEDLGILGAVAAEPDVALVVHVDAMHGLRPFVALARATP